MSGERIAKAAMLVAMLGVAAFAWWLRLRPPLEVDASRLRALPLDIGDWRGRSIPIEGEVERMLDADANLQRAYWSPFSESVVWLYVGYYGTQRGGHPEHTPDVCYPSAGWTIEGRRDRAVDPKRGLRVNEFVVAKGGERRLVEFWYRSLRRTGMLGSWDVTLDQMRSRLVGGRVDGALVRVSTPIEAGGEPAARSRLFAFADAVDVLLDGHWPRERPAR